MAALQEALAMGQQAAEAAATLPKPPAGLRG
jgi:hypothetical protein